MKKEEIIKGLDQLGKLMSALGENRAWQGYETGVTQEEFDSLNVLIGRQISYNGWYTESNIRNSLKALGNLLTEELLSDWTNNYNFSKSPKKIAIIMAGNIPLVGFHDFIAVLLSGHIAICKLSSEDKTLLPKLSEHLINFVPALKERIIMSEGRIAEMDAVIATGSDNSVRYFEEYFGKYPHIFRGNRTSIAVLNGTESNQELELLGEDILTYFGLGCRSVSHLIVPENYNFDRFFEAIFNQSDIIHNNKYGNNYDYNRAVFLLNQHKMLDNNFLLLHESRELFSPLAMVYYHAYKNQDEVDSYLNESKDKIQVIVGKDYLPFGEAQSPDLSDYADNVDTMLWLSDL